MKHPQWHFLLLPLSFLLILALPDITAYKIAFFGDSITKGSLTGNYAYPDYIKTMGYEVTKFAKGGNTVYNIYNDTWKAEGQGFKYCFVMVGTNDIFQSTDYTAYKLKLRDVVNKLRVNCKVVLLTIPDSKSNYGVDKINECIRTVGQWKNVPVWDTNSVFNYDTSLYVDSYHPNLDGQKIIADYIKVRMR